MKHGENSIFISVLSGQMWIAMVPADGMKMKPQKQFSCHANTSACQTTPFKDTLVDEPRSWFGHILPQLTKITFPGNK